MYSKISFGSQYNSANRIYPEYSRRETKHDNKPEYNGDKTLQQELISPYNPLSVLGRSQVKHVYPEMKYLEQFNYKEFEFGPSLDHSYNVVSTVSYEKNECGYFVPAFHCTKTLKLNEPKEYFKKDLDDDVKGVRITGTSPTGSHVFALLSRNEKTNKTTVRLYEHGKTDNSKELSFDCNDPQKLIDATKVVVNNLKDINTAVIWK